MLVLFLLLSLLSSLAQYQPGYPVQECPYSFLVAKSLDETCKTHCGSCPGLIVNSLIPCVGNLNPNTSVPDFCQCGSLGTAGKSCHLPRIDICMYPAHSEKECENQTRNFAYSWSCTTYTDADDGSIISSMYCNSSIAMLRSFSGLPCPPTPQPVPDYPPIPTGEVQVGDFFFLNFWSYNTPFEWTMLSTFFIAIILLVFLICICCCNLKCACCWCCYSEEELIVFANEVNPKKNNSEDVQIAVSFELKSGNQ
jgi:hypothetical protein